MTLAYVVTEGPEEAAFLSAILRPMFGESVYVAVGGGRSAAQATARSILVAKRRPVILMADADTLNEQVATEKRIYLQESLERVSHGLPHLVILSQPEFEVIPVSDERFVRHILGRELGGSEQELARAIPRKFLEKQLGQPALRQILNRTNEGELLSLASRDPALRLLTRFLETAVTAGLGEPTDRVS